MKMPFYPARPVNGGPLPKALPKTGPWVYEPKVNGWRALVHCPTGAMFNRHGQRLSIEREFRPVLERLRTVTNPEFEWLDTEAFERRHHYGRGSLVLLDAPLLPGTYTERQQTAYDRLTIAESWAHEQFPAPENRLLRFAYAYAPGDDTDPLLAWPRLQAVNRALKADVFEGLVAKRTDSKYPRQLRSADQEFPFWMKHRWAF